MDDKLTSKNLYDLLIKYSVVKEDNTILRTLFNYKEGKSYVSKFFYYGKNNEKIYVGGEGYSYRLNRIFNLETGELHTKWLKGMRANHKGILDNIKDTFKYIPNDNLNDLKDELDAISDEIGYCYDEVVGQDLKNSLINHMYNLFIYSIGDEDEVDIAYDPSYMFQTIERSDGLTKIHMEAPNLKIIQDERFILIKSPGGMGKTTFINKLYDRIKGNKVFTGVYKVDLSLIYLYISKKEVYAFNSGITLLTEFISKSENLVKSEIDLSRSNLLLFDGLNELFIFKDLRVRNLILDGIKYLKENYSNLSFIITTRDSEGNYSYRDIDFLWDFKEYHLKGVRDSEIKKLSDRLPYLKEDILNLSKIPLYYNYLITLNDDNSVKNKYDILKGIYRKIYLQSKNYGENFLAFYVIAPKISSYMNEKSISYVTLDEIYDISKKVLISKGLNLLIRSALNECDGNATFNIDMEKTINLLLNHGPLNEVRLGNNGSKSYRFFHDEIRKYLLSYNMYLDINSLRIASDIKEIEDIYLDLNSDDDTAILLKYRLGLDKDSDEDLRLRLNGMYNIQDSYDNLTLEIIYVNTAFLLSEFIRFGHEEIDNIHFTMLPLTRKVIDIIDDGNLDRYILNLNDKERLRVKTNISEILSKHVEFYRKHNEFEEGLRLLKIASKVIPDSEEILNQRAKLYLKYIECNIDFKRGISERLDVSQDLREMYSEALNITKLGAKRKFNLSVNLIQSLYTTPNPIQYLLGEEYGVLRYEEAFYLECNTIFSRDDYSGYDVLYTIRQALNLLFKGYVGLRDGYSYGRGKIIDEEDIVLGNKDTFNIGENELKLGRELLSRVIGYNYPSLNYYRAILKYYEKEYDRARELFLSDEGSILSKIILNYKFGYSYDIDREYDKIIAKIEEGNTTFEKCDPIYYGIIDGMNLELSLNKDRAYFYKDLESRLPNIYKRILSISREMNEIRKY